MRVRVKVFRLDNREITNSDIAGKLAANVKSGGHYSEDVFSVYGSWVGRRVDDRTLILRLDRPFLLSAARRFAKEIGERWEDSL